MRRLAPIFFLIAASRYAGAQTATDGSVGPALRLDGKDIVIDAALGARQGANLFHSFETFNIQRNGSATFTGPAGIQNVISRVTGGEASAIEGMLRSEIGSEGFFFINPAGVVISGGASIDVPGTFHVSNATSLTFADGTIWLTGDAATSELTIAAPEAFGFLGAGTSEVEIEGAALSITSGRDLNIAGSSIQIENAAIALNGGELRIQAAAANAPTNGEPSAIGRLEGDAAIIGSSLTVNDGGVLIGAGGLVLSETTITVTATGTSRIGPALLLGGGDVSITGGLLSVVSTGSANNGRLAVSGGRLRISGADLTTKTAGEGDGGDIVLQGDSLTLRNSAVQSVAESTGSGGDLMLRGGEIRLGNTRLETYNTGGVVPNYTPGTYLDLSENDFFQIIGGEGDVGSIRVSGDRIRLFDTTISSNTVGAGAGGSIRLDSGDIALRRADLRTSNRNALSEGQLSYAYSASNYGVPPGGFRDAFVFGAEGSVGSVSITGDRLMLRNSRIESRWYGRGPGGRLDISADTLITRSAERGVPLFDFGFGAANVIQLTSDRPGPTLTLNVGTLRLHDAGIGGASVGDASGGDIGIGAGGVSLRDSSIMTSVQGARGGAIMLSSDSVALSGNSSIDTRTGGAYSAAEPRTPGGAITITTGPLMILDGSAITTSRLSPDEGGSISIRASELAVAGSGYGGGIQSLRTSGDGGFYGYNAYINFGGNIDIAVNGLIRISDGGVETSSSTTYQYGLSGGNITISGDLIVLGRNGVIRATADDGDGGAISVATTGLFATSGATIDASSTLGVDGPIIINGLDNPNTAETADLAPSFLDAGAVIANPCLAALIGRSELILSKTPGYTTDAPTSLLLGVVSPETAEMTVEPVAAIECSAGE